MLDLLAPRTPGYHPIAAVAASFGVDAPDPQPIEIATVREDGFSLRLRVFA
jgi:hypothetical protein